MDNIWHDFQKSVIWGHALVSFQPRILIYPKFVGQQ